MNNEASVKKSTQLKVMESVKALNYVPNISARSQAGARSYSIGYIYDNLNAYYTIDMQAGILSECKKHHSTIERLEGYRAALIDNGIKPKKRFEMEGEYSFDSGVEGTENLLRIKNIPTAIFANNDEIAAGSVFAARLNGIDIPNELSIVGFEDSPYSRQTRPKLTTAHQPNKLKIKI
jgi:DNA-binding LacI/PurR family transcriptional regulator